ncbi:MAG: hypothetical protein V2A63_02960 [Patescibacteria group bacterium]
MDDFPGLRAGERVLFVIRKVFAAYLGIMFKFLVNLGVVFLLSYFVVEKFPHGSISYFIFVEMLIFYLLGAWWFLFNGWLDEELDTIIITSERLIDTTESAFMSIAIASADLDEIQDVRGRVAGFLGGMLRFGDLEVQTASHTNVFFMEYIKNPEGYIDTLIELKNKYVAAQSGT